MNFSSNNRANQALPSMIIQQRRNEEGRISVGQQPQAQTLDTPPATQNLTTCSTGLTDTGVKAAIESLNISGSSSAPNSATTSTIGPKKTSPPSAPHKLQGASSSDFGDDDGLNDTRKLLGQASTGSESDTNKASSNEQNKAQVFEKLDAFVQEQKDEEASKMTPPETAEASLTLNDMTSTTSHNNADEPRSSRRISFSRLDDVMTSDDDDHDHDDDEKSMTLDDLMEVSAGDRASPPLAPTSVPDFIRSSAENTTTTTTVDYEVSIEAPLREEGSSCRRSSAISFECHDSVLLDLLSQEISDEEDDIDPRRNPSFYNESIGAPNVLSRMDQSILNREVATGRLARDGMHFSFSNGLNLDDLREE